MEKKDSITLRLFGGLHKYMREIGLSDYVEIAVPPEGKSGEEIAQELDIPLEKIEAVFRNGLVQSVLGRVFPGDRVAFIPYGIPGPYRVLLGIRQPDHDDTTS